MHKLIFTMGVVAASALHGQVINVNDTAFQALGNPVLSNVRVLDEGFGNQTVKGKPFSATEERHSLQVLGDGTRIENTQTNRLFRDADGRTRVEEMNGTVTMFDPATRIRTELDPAAKTARKSNGLGGFYMKTGENLNDLVTSLRNQITTAFTTSPTNMQGVMSETTENLGSQAVNGVTAQGVRTTMIIPKGQIGNSRDIKVMTERWSSADLQMLVKSINSDPRFGDTTYQLTKVTQGAPDPALFQIPSDYTVTEQGAGARGFAYGAGAGIGVGPAPKAPSAARGKPQ